MQHEGKFLRNYLKVNEITQESFAKKIGISRQAINRWFNNRELSKTQKDAIEKVFGRNIFYIKPLKNIERAPRVEENEANYVPYYSHAEAYASPSEVLTDVVAFKRETFNRIPIFEKGEAIVQVTGNSMKGFINHGDYIIIKRIYDIKSIIYGEAYYIITKANQQKTVKFINQYKGDDSLLWLSSYNIEQFDSQTIEKTDILELYEIIGGMRSI